MRIEPRARAETILHPKEETELRERAKTNVREDLDLLRSMAARRSRAGTKRGRFLGSNEFRYLEKLLVKLETL